MPSFISRISIWGRYVAAQLILLPIDTLSVYFYELAQGRKHCPHHISTMASTSLHGLQIKLQNGVRLLNS